MGTIVAFSIAMLSLLFLALQPKKLDKALKKLTQQRDQIQKLQKEYDVTDVLMEIEGVFLANCMLGSNLMSITLAVGRAAAYSDKLSEIIASPDKHLKRI